MTTRRTETRRRAAGGNRQRSAPNGWPAALRDNSNDIFEAMGIPVIPEPEFRELTAIILGEFGIKITLSKLTLLTGRVHPILVRHGFQSHREYIEALKADGSGKLLSELANCVSTNHTAFFREESHFDLLLDAILPKMTAEKRARNDRDIRIWSAACSTGEEAYTLQMCLFRHLGLDYGNWRAGVLATDISASALKQARAGRYNAQKIEPIPPDYLDEFFRPAGSDMYEVVPRLRREVTFRRLNLVGRPFPFKKPFDIIFCRNVMIYFNQAMRERLVSQLYEWTVPGGHLFIGHSESIINPGVSYKRVGPAVYQRKRASHG